ncbi:MAG: hypothetical protein C0502_02485 [Opitutus sp.]|nr:hypothetical protein [Opitutus sp.]
MLCEIRAATGALAAELEHVVTYCAAQAGIHATVLQLPSGGTGTAQITLRLPPEAAGPGERVWCLVCRLACLCPQARVGVLVQAAPAFAPPPTRIAI